MIQRVKVKDNHLFSDLELNFEKNLVIFTGASGSGKSVMMNLLLTLFGYKDEQASLLEADIEHSLSLDEFGIENESPNILRRTTQKSSRYFINGSALSKKNILSISKSFINYLNLREFSEFENENLLNLLDNIYKKEDSYHDKLLNEFKKLFLDFKEVSKKLKQIEDEEKKVEDLKEFAKFEIEKISSINPKVDEYDELIELKKKLSKKEKIESAIQKAYSIFDNQDGVIEALDMLDEDSTFFTEALNELTIKLESAKDSLDELDELDIEELLDRLEQLSSLKSRYGSIEEALSYLQEKQKELSHYENLSFEKQELEEQKNTLFSELENTAKKITLNRQKALKTLNHDINIFTKELFLSPITFKLDKTTLSHLGKDEVQLTLGDTTLQKVSSGELNRIRLAFLATSSNYLQNGGVLILDEIDANLSGKESNAVAKVLALLSKYYQIFAISHQPQLSSYALEHFLVYKDAKQSFVKKLNPDERVTELSRMISGDAITDEAVNFAKKLLKESQI